MGRGNPEVGDRRRRQCIARHGNARPCTIVTEKDALRWQCAKDHGDASRRVSAERMSLRTVHRSRQQEGFVKNIMQQTENSPRTSFTNNWKTSSYSLSCGPIRFGRYSPSVSIEMTLRPSSARRFIALKNDGRLTASVSCGRV